MITIRKRWPILTAAIGAVAFGATNFEIAGLEHLTIRAKSGTESSNIATQPGYASGQPGTGNSFGVGGLDLTNFGIQLSRSPQIATGENLGPTLSLAEKLAVWEQRQIGSQTTLPSTSPSLPVSTPLLPDPTFSSQATSSSPGSPAPIWPQPSGPSGAHVVQMPDSLMNEYSEALNAASANVQATGLPALGFSEGRLASQGGLAPAGDSDATTSSSSPSIRVGTYNAASFSKLAFRSRELMPIAAQLLASFDLIAIQSIETQRDDLLPLLVDQLNRLTSRRFDYLIGPRVGQGAEREQFAFIFDTAKLETDRFAMYTVDDPENLVTFDPLVAWFRCKAVPANEAFTFSAINCRLVTPREQNWVRNIAEAVVADGRNEDDWLLFADIGMDPRELGCLAGQPIRFAVPTTPTDLAGSGMKDCILASALATPGYLGRGGAIDFLRKMNLSIDQASSISHRLPVWAEFSALERPEPGRIDPLPVL